MLWQYCASHANKALLNWIERETEREKEREKERERGEKEGKREKRERERETLDWILKWNMGSDWKALPDLFQTAALQTFTCLSNIQHTCLQTDRQRESPSTDKTITAVITDSDSCLNALYLRNASKNNPDGVIRTPTWSLNPLNSSLRWDRDVCGIFPHSCSVLDYNKPADGCNSTRSPSRASESIF